MEPDWDFLVLVQDQGWEYVGQPPLVTLEEFTAGHSEKFGMTRAVLVEGNTVICMEFSMGNEDFTLENWLQIMTDRLIQ